MATAKRVAQDAKVEGTVTKTHYETFEVMYKNGVEVLRYRKAEHLDVDDTQRIVPQPDRIALDVSLDEAWEIRTALDLLSNSKAAGVRMALVSALLSPNTGTQTSSGAVSGRNAGSLLRPAVDLSAKCGTATGSGAYDHKAAQVAQQKALIDCKMRWMASRW